MGKTVNQTILMGRLVRDIDVRTTTGGDTVGNFTLASDKETGDTANFFDVTVWGKLAELVSKYTKRGSKVLVMGKLDHQTWEKEGEKRSKVVVIARDVTFLDSKRDETPKSSDIAPQDVNEGEIDLSQIPF